MQDIAVFVIVAGAAAYVVRSWWLQAQGKKSCGGCKSCGASQLNDSAPSPSSLVQIDLNGSWKK